MIFKNFQALCEKKYSSFICESFIKIITLEEKTELIKNLDFDYILKSNNRHLIKIMKALGIYQNETKNFLFPISSNSDFVNGNINKNMGK